jgi:hypothetical protein
MPLEGAACEPALNQPTLEAPSDRVGSSHGLYSRKLKEIYEKTNLRVLS